MLTIGIHYLSDVASLDLRGKFIKGQGGFQLQMLVDKVLTAGTRHMLLNMTEVPMLDSMAIGEVVRAFKRVSDAGGSLKLVGLTDRVYGALKITQLLDLIETYKTEEEAVASFKPEKSKEAKPKGKSTRAKKTEKRVKASEEE